MSSNGLRWLLRCTVSSCYGWPFLRQANFRRHDFFKVKLSRTSDAAIAVAGSPNVWLSHPVYAFQPTIHWAEGSQFPQKQAFLEKTPSRRSTSHHSPHRCACSESRQSQQSPVSGLSCYKNAKFVRQCRGLCHATNLQFQKKSARPMT